MSWFCKGPVGSVRRKERCSKGVHGPGAWARWSWQVRGGKAGSWADLSDPLVASKTRRIEPVEQPAERAKQFEPGIKVGHPSRFGRNHDVSNNDNTPSKIRIMANPSGLVQRVSRVKSTKLQAAPRTGSQEWRLSKRIHDVGVSEGVLPSTSFPD